jgi:hypothetical protein
MKKKLAKADKKKNEASRVVLGLKPDNVLARLNSMRLPAPFEQRLTTFKSTLDGVIAKQSVHNRAKHGQAKAYVDALVCAFLEQFHTGTIEASPLIDPTEGGCDGYEYLLDLFQTLVTRGDGAGIRRIADAVERVHERAKGKGKSFRIPPASKILANAIAHVEKNGPPQSIAETRALMLAAGFLKDNLDEREVRRWHKDLGGASGKRGRPLKPDVTPKVKKPAFVSLKEVRAHAAAASAKLTRLLDKKPATKNRTKPRETPS